MIVYGALWLKHRHLEKSQWFTLGACLVLGGLTLAFHEDTFLKWKAPLVNWLFALAFAGSHFIGDKPMIQRIMGHAIQLPQGLCAPEHRLGGVLPGVRLRQPVRGLHLSELLGGLQGVRQPRHDLFLIGQGLFLARHLHDADTGEKPKD